MLLEKSRKISSRVSLGLGAGGGGFGIKLGYIEDANGDVGTLRRGSFDVVTSPALGRCGYTDFAALGRSTIV
jgi:hypothetical protein